MADSVNFLRELAGCGLLDDENCAALRAAATEIERLEKWKAEAMEVLPQWDEVWEALGKPGVLGGSKAAASKAEVEKLQGLLEAVADDCGEEYLALLGGEDV